MGKPTATQPEPKRDGFFNKKHGLMKKIRPFRESAIKSGKVAPSSSSADSGSFFVTSTEKQELLLKRNTNQKFKVDRRNQAAHKSGDEKPKKVFDKKLWRIQKYSKKYKLDQWEEKRKKKVLHQYYKQINDDEPKFDVQKIYEQYKDEDDEDDNEDNKSEEIENENNLNKNIIDDKIEIAKLDQNEPQASASQTRKKKAFKKAHLEYQRIQDEKKRKKEDREKQKIEKAEALKEYKQKKLEKYKKLNKKTKKGQPIMKYRMEMLLEQIQKSVQQ